MKRSVKGRITSKNNWLPPTIYVTVTNYLCPHYPQNASIRAYKHSVPERTFSGTKSTLGAQKGSLVYRTHLQRHSVQETPSYGTEGIFGTGNPLLGHETAHVCENRLPGARNEAPDAAMEWRYIYIFTIVFSRSRLRLQPATLNPGILASCFPCLSGRRFLTGVLI